MRPVNLIPPEDRRGDRAPLRAGSLSYAVVGVLAAALIAITSYVITGNSVTDKENQLAQLEAEEQTLAAEAQALAPYAEFASLQSSRKSTISSLAQSRFDWERVMRELAIVNPKDVFLLELSGTAGADIADAQAKSLAAPGTPALTFLGCSLDQNAVAGFVAALEDIDGVTRVGLSSSVLEDQADSDCTERGLPYAFEATASFDGVAPAAEAGASTVPAPTPGTEDANSAQVATDRAGEVAE